MTFLRIVPSAGYTYQPRMTNDEHPEVCACDRCNRPMKLISSVPKLGGPTELLVFYCRVCDEVSSKHNADNVPTMWRRTVDWIRHQD